MAVRKTLFILFLVFPLSIQGEIYAVLVGISEYASGNNLTYCHRDAIDMYTMLKDCTTPDKIVLLTDRQAKLDSIVFYTKKLFRQAQPDDMVLFFFSGHGNKNVFFAYDKSLYFSALQTIFKQTKARRKLIFADACFAGTLRQSGDQTASTSGKSSAGTNVLLFLSTRSNQHAQENITLENGIFTHFLVAGLKGDADANKDGYITAIELFNFVYPKVRERTNSTQIPVMWGNFDRNMIVLKLNSN